ncbi:MAG TPA: molybdopterin-guanine dinucleotide biosynthesis protein B [bacterium]|nr:molybdopterin-guanine dinucleotide biosynthesis protein B [bacterium]
MQLEEALEHLLATTVSVPAEGVPVQEACGRVAADDVLAPGPVPHFSRAAMDGFVCHDADLRDVRPEQPAILRVTGAVRMGEPPGTGPRQGEAWAITTGGPLPRHGDRVVPLEAGRLVGDRLRIERPVGAKSNIAGVGEDISSGALLVRTGEVIPAPATGALAACGIQMLKVYRRPHAALVATGSELVELSAAETVLPSGRVINSNAVTLAGELRAAGCSVDYRGVVSDRPEDLHAAFASLRDGYDVVISTGGVSVGRYDAVHRTWLDLGAQRIVGRVDLKPGGPFFAGRLGNAWALGLSGTPVACLAAFHLLVRPFLRRLGGARHTIRPLVMGVLATGFPRPTDRMRALWARVDSPAEGIPEVELLVGRRTGNFASLLPANALVLLPSGTPPLPPGSRVTTLLLDRQEDRTWLEIRAPVPGPAVVGVTGESGSGKTAVIAGLIRRLAATGIRAVAVKHAAHGFTLDRPGSDSARVMEAGAGIVVLAGPDETVFRIAADISDPDRIARMAADTGVHVWGRAPDLVIVEGFDHAARPVIHVGPQKPGAAAGEIWAALPVVASLTRPELERELDHLAALVGTRLRRESLRLARVARSSSARG